MAIDRLTLKDTVTAATYFAINVNGQDYRAAADSILAYIQDNLVFPTDLVSQYVAPIEASTTQVNDGSANVWLILTPAGGLTNATIKLPLLANCIDQQEINVNCTQAITNLTFNGNGASIVGGPSTMTANGFFKLRFDDVMNTWYRVG